MSPTFRWCFGPYAAAVGPGKHPGTERGQLSRRGLLNSSLAAAAMPTDEPGVSSGSNRGRVVNVRDFGAKGNGTADDAPAINAAIQFVREHLTRVGPFGVAPKLLLPAGIYAVRRSIDLTRLHGINLVIEGDSSVILGTCAGEPVIDALGSRWLTIRDLTIVGEKLSPPKLGLQIGLAKNNVVADDHRLTNVKIIGSYSLACLLNISAETTGFHHVMLWNDFQNPESYCLIQDGLNHFNTTSAFVSGQAAQRETDSSFNENEFINCDFRHGGGGVPVWLGDTARHRFIRCYAASQGAASFVVYCGPNSHTMLDVDCHCEAIGLRSVFLFTGPSPRPRIRGFSYTDHTAFAADSVFRCDAGVENVTLQNARIEVAGVFERSCKVFDDPRRWTVTGSYYSADIPSWNGAECFTGSVLLGNEVAYAGAVAMKAPSGLTHQRPSGLDRVDAGRLFLDLSLNKLIVWSGQDWIDTMGAKV